MLTISKFDSDRIIRGRNAVNEKGGRGAAHRGYSPAEFVLRMAHEEIGAYLELELDTVSRMLSNFQ